MIFRNKKALNPITFIVMGLIVVGLLLLLTIFLLQTTDVFIDENKKNAQLINNQLLNKNCFSNHYGIIEKVNFNQENIDECLKNFQDELIRVYLSDNNVFYFNSKKEEFLHINTISCPYNEASCFENKYPIILKDEENTSNIDVLTIQVVN